MAERITLVGLFTSDEGANGMMTSFDLNQLDQLAQLPAEHAMVEAGQLLESLVNQPSFLRAHILPLLSRVAPARDPHIARTFLSPEGRCSLQVFVWAPGSGTPIHDHTSWGAYYCALGSVIEDRYERLDDGAQLNRAHLRASWRRSLRRDDGASTVAPYAGGIHRIANPGSRPAISVHLYGPRLGALDGRDYDPSRDYVCDRYEGDMALAH
jgi:predicted metal-dependent enzyme (double-stranded beta helix superfamily)